MTALRCIERRTPTAMFFKKTVIFSACGFDSRSSQKPLNNLLELVSNSQLLWEDVIRNAEVAQSVEHQTKKCAKH